MSGNPWEQDFVDDNDGYLEGFDDEQDELGLDMHTGVGMDPMHTGRGVPVLEGMGELDEVSRQPRQPPKSPMHVQQGKPRKARIRPMSAKMMQRFPAVTSMLLTLDNGQQVLFVRNGRDGR